jgi:hypothetical protein
MSLFLVFCQLAVLFFKKMEEVKVLLNAFSYFREQS